MELPPDVLPVLRGEIGLSGVATVRDAGANGIVGEWGAQAVVTALEADEADWLGVGGFGEAVERAGADWFHVPILDGWIPDTDSQALWHHACVRLARRLWRGERVFIHCHAGLGRTGALAASLLVRLGEAPRDAIDRVRAARPGCLQTMEQEQYAMAERRGTPPDDAPTPDERILGCLSGGAVGDAFGYAVEFESLDAIRRRHGPEGLVEPVLDETGRLVVSDDTQMTMFTAEGLIRAWQERPEPDVTSIGTAVARAYLDWLDTQGEVRSTSGSFGWLADEAALRHRRAPGNTCLSALHGLEPRNPAPARNHSKGCGGVMRIAPVGLAVPAPEAARFGASLARLTHGHPGGYLPAAALAVALRGLVDGADPVEAVRAGVDVIAGEEGARETVDLVRRALDIAADRDTLPVAAIRELGEGWTGPDALAIGVYAALRGDDFADVVRIAANHDGDSDSTASIAGQLYGAWKGVDVVPHRWVRRLDVLVPLLTLAHDLGGLADDGRDPLRSYLP